MDRLLVAIADGTRRRCGPRWARAQGAAAPPCDDLQLVTADTMARPTRTGQDRSDRQVGQAAVRLAVALVVARFDDDRLRRRPRWRVEVSNGRWVEAGLSCSAHQSVLL
jgi:hypothetical protein